MPIHAEISNVKDISIAKTIAKAKVTMLFSLQKTIDVIKSAHMEMNKCH